MHAENRDQQNRFTAFQLTNDDIVLLRTGAGALRERIPALLVMLHDAFAPWPEIKQAMMDGEVHALRMAHWMRVVSGEFGEGYLASARQLARLLLDHNVPGFALAICHASFTNAAVKELRAAPGHKPRLGKPGDNGAPLRAALNKAAWMDLEVLLETYAQAERENKSRVMQKIADAFEKKILSVADDVMNSSRQLESSVGAISNMASRSSDASASAAVSAEQASDNVQTVASASEELSTSVTEISHQVSQSTRVASQAVKDAEHTNAVVQALAEGAQKIGDVVNLINEIAGQTNLLALNATIEAARAGEAGKGFAVVATEVKSLATQTAKATSDIGRQIADIQSATQEAVEAIRSIAATIGEVNDIAATIAAAVEEQDATTKEITRNMHQAASGNEQVRAAILGIRNAATQTLDIVSEVGGAAQGLGRQSAMLHEAVQAFLNEIRAA